MEEMHVLLKNRGKINPRSSQEYADRGGFEALKKALSMDSLGIEDSEGRDQNDVTSDQLCRIPGTTRRTA